MTFKEWQEKWQVGRVGSVGNGWVPILDELMTDLKTLGWVGEVSQVKEKFGLLRFYAFPITKEQQDRVLQAEYASKSVCEYCGQPGETQGNARGWLKTTCSGCRNRTAWDEL